MKVDRTITQSKDKTWLGLKKKKRWWLIPTILWVKYKIPRLKTNQSWEWSNLRHNLWCFNLARFFKSTRQWSLNKLHKQKPPFSLQSWLMPSLKNSNLWGNAIDVTQKIFSIAKESVTLSRQSLRLYMNAYPVRWRRQSLFTLQRGAFITCLSPKSLSQGALPVTIRLDSR